MTRKKDVEKEYGLPAGSLDGIQAFFEIEENQKAFEAWLARRPQEPKEEKAA